MKTLLFYLKVSRPGLWFPTLWLYMMPLSGVEFWNNGLFWLGLFYVLFPMNFLVYGWNDIVDYEADKLNPRKDSYLFGARGSKAQLKKMIPAIVLSQLLIYPIFIFMVGWQIAIIYAAQLLVMWAYNFPNKGLRSMPPFEMLCQFGYVLVVPFSIYVNGVDALPWQTYAYLAMFAVQSHLMGEVMDIGPDKQAGKTTTATLIGMARTKWIIMSLVLTESIWVLYFYKDIFFAAMLFAGVIWLLLDYFVIFKNRQYTLKEMNLFGIGTNLVALASMAYVLWSGCLSEIKI
jgi:4-hydroxybenzoate polyprenyltransferase